MSSHLAKSGALGLLGLNCIVKAKAGLDQADPEKVKVEAGNLKRELGGNLMDSHFGKSGRQDQLTTRQQLAGKIKATGSEMPLAEIYSPRNEWLVRA